VNPSLRASPIVASASLRMTTSAPWRKWVSGEKDFDHVSEGMNILHMNEYINEIKDGVKCTYSQTRQ